MLISNEKHLETSKSDSKTHTVIPLSLEHNKRDLGILKLLVVLLSERKIDIVIDRNVVEYKEKRFVKPIAFFLVMSSDITIK